MALIKSAPSPKNEKELQAFLRPVNVYPWFFEGKPEVPELLHRLLDQERKWLWAKEHESVFQNLIGLPSWESVLARYDTKRHLVLPCLVVGSGAVLLHKHNDGA